MAKITFDVELEIPKGANVSLDRYTLAVKGPKGEVKRVFENPKYTMKVEGEKLLILCKSKTPKLVDKMMVNTAKAHVKNMFKGATEGYHAKVKVFSGHFPITASMEGNFVIIKNFLGEKVPRKTEMMKGVKTVVQGDMITIEGPDREAVSQSAAKIENLTRITDKDRRVFQDGCYIIEKAGGKKI